MFKLSKRNPASPTETSGDSILSSAANSSLAPTDVQQELIKVAFKDTLKHTGVPAQWIACEIRKTGDLQPSAQLEVRLVIKKWSGHLLRYAFAFQTQFKQCLDRYEPHIDHSQYDWTWKFSDNCDCPFPSMPAPQEWAQKLQASQHKISPPTGQIRIASASPTNSAKEANSPAGRGFEMRDIFADLKS
jgi:hypothetical protein